MKRRLTASLLALGLLAGSLTLASTASATPGKTKACSNCHKSSRSVHVSVKRLSSTATKATYSVTVSGGKGKGGWAVLSGGKNLAHKTASTGRFTVSKGKTIRVWAVKKGSGSTSKSIAVK